jgi:CheY-like chemotaxis protein
VNTDSSPRPRALIVEDDPLLRELLATVAGDLGCEVVACSDADAGIQAAAEGRFDLIVSDIRLPGAADGALYRALAVSDPAQAARVVFVTGDLMNPGTRALIEASGRPVIGKPFGLAELTARLGEELGRPSAP